MTEDRDSSLADAARASRDEILNGKGYVLLERHFDPTPVLDVLRAYVDEHVEHRGGALFSGGYRPSDVLGEEVVQELMLDPLLLEIGRLCVGSRPAYGSLGANCVPPGSAGMDPHIDYPYFAMGDGLPHSAFPALCVQLIWYLVDVEEDCGPTLALPGTQVRPSRPLAAFRDMAERVTAKAGTVFVGHGALWHGVAPNTTDRVRHVILGSYVPFWVQPMLTNSYGWSRSPGMDVLLRSDMGRRIGEGYSATIASARELPVPETMDGGVPDDWDEETGPSA